RGHPSRQGSICIWPEAICLLPFPSAHLRSPCDRQSRLLRWSLSGQTPEWKKRIELFPVQAQSECSWLTLWKFPSLGIKDMFRGSRTCLSELEHETGLEA